MGTPYVFEFQVKPTQKGLLWALCECARGQLSGILSIEWEKYKKQILFRNGEPADIKSNWAQEAFGNFLIRQKVITSDVLRRELHAKDEKASKLPIGEWLCERGLISAAKMPEFLEQHFRERLFNLLGLSHGNIRFTKLDDEAFQSENARCRLTAPFLTLLSESVRSVFTEAVSKQKLSPYLSRSARITGPSPLPLIPQELRFWNQLQSTEVAVSALKEVSLRLLALASEFELAYFADSSEEKLFKELQSLEHKFSKANPFEILGLPPDASAEQCKKAFHDMIRQYHPDRLPPNAKTELRSLSETLFSRINEANAILMDPERRADFQARQELEKAGGIDQLQLRVKAEMDLSQAKSALKRRHFKAAFELLNEIAKVLKDDAEVIADRAFSEWMSLAESKIDLKKKLSRFGAEIEKSIQLRSNYAEAHYYRGLLFKTEGSVERALESFEQAVKLDPKLTEASSEVRFLRMRKDKKAK